MLPTVSTSYNEVVNFFYGTVISIGEYRFENVIVVPFVVESTEERVISHKLLNRFVVVMNDGVFTTCYIFEYYNPVISENLYVEYINHDFIPNNSSNQSNKLVSLIEDSTGVGFSLDGIG